MEDYLIGVGGLAITIFTTFVLSRLVSPHTAFVTSGWMPYLLLLMFYWHAGQFVTHAEKHLEERLVGLDCSVVAPLLEWCARQSAGFWILGYLEFAHLFRYVSLRMGLAALYILREGHAPDRFWAITLAATYPYYGLLPYI